jgi:hypothetical protein
LENDVADFSNYDLREIQERPMALYELGDGLLPEMAQVTGFDLAAEPDKQNLYEFAGHIGKEKTLQDNIPRMRELLSGVDSPTTVAADWVERSGVLEPVRRSFVRPEATFPETFGIAAITGNVANWTLRRLAMLERFAPGAIEGVVLAGGSRVMKSDEHVLVDEVRDRAMGEYDSSMGDSEDPVGDSYELAQGKPTEYDFLKHYVHRRLLIAGFDARRIRTVMATSDNGDKVLDDMFEEGRIGNNTILVPVNAPNSVQAAGQLRQAARRYMPGFDDDGDKIFMVSDSYPLARKGQHKSTHQDPFSALGQIARNAQQLLINAQS